MEILVNININSRIFIKLLICLVFLVFILPSEMIYASQAYPGSISVKQSDGSQLTIKLYGDEHHHWVESVDGYTLIVNGKGDYEYAKLNSIGGLEPSGVIANDLIERTSLDNNFLSTIDKKLSFDEQQQSILRQLSKVRSNFNNRTQAFPTTGSRKLICILMGYSDLAFSKTQTEFDNLFNQVSYSVDGATGSVKDYYLENSWDQFNLTVDIAGPYTASNTMAYYGANNTAGYDERPRELVTEAVNAADVDVNFADYDNDSDGNVDGVYVIYAGYGEEAGASSDAIWAHAWSITTVNLDGVNISSYSCSAELRSNSGTGITRIGVVCHEFGHVLGAPDYYDTDYATGGQYSGTGQWDMMAGGSWNNNGATPAHHNGFTKWYYYGWITPTLLSTTQNVTLLNIEDNQSLYYYTTPTTNEYFLVENRQQTGFDGSLPGSGMIIYHVDQDNVDAYDPTNKINATHPQYMYPVCASATTEPSATPSDYGSINSTGCPFPGASNTTSFTDLTIPSSKDWNGSNSGKTITSIVENSGVITFDYSVGATPTPQISVNPTILTESLQIDQTSIKNLVISNVGDATLDWTMSIMNQSQPVQSALRRDIDYSLCTGGILSANKNEIDINSQNSSEESPITNSIDKAIVNHDGGHDGNAIGIGGGSFIVAARYTSDELSSYYDTHEINEVQLFIYDAATSVILAIWEGGSFGDPGTQIYGEEVISQITVGDWSEISLTASIPIVTDNEYWVGYQVTGGTYPAGVDAGPAIDGKGDWVNIGSWTELQDHGFDFNWNIRMVIDEIPPSWVSVDPTSGSIPAGGDQAINVTFDATGLSLGMYTADLDISSNDPGNSTVTVPCTLNVVDDSSLPVELAGFEVKEENGRVLLEWTTESELENLGFNVYRSIDDVNYEKINESLIEGAINSSTSNDYTFIDTEVKSNMQYYYKLEDVSTKGETEMHGPRSISLSSEKSIVSEFNLSAAYPNPFNPETTIKFTIPEECKVTINVYDMRGNLVSSLTDRNYNIGQYQVNWNGSDKDGKPVSAGVYIYKMSTNTGFTKSSKMILVK